MARRRPRAPKHSRTAWTSCSPRSPRTFPDAGGATMSREDYDKGMKMRRKTLGDEWVDRAERTKTAFNADFQELITRYCWNDIWNRPGLPPKIRRMLVIAMTAAIGRWEEFSLHVR